MEGSVGRPPRSSASIQIVPSSSPIDLGTPSRTPFSLKIARPRYASVCCWVVTLRPSRVCDLSFVPASFHIKPPTRFPPCN